MLILLNQVQQWIYKSMDSALCDAVDQGHPEAEDVLNSLQGRIEDEAYIVYMESGRYLEDAACEGSVLVVEEWMDNMDMLVSGAKTEGHIFNVDGEQWHLKRRIY